LARAEEAERLAAAEPDAAGKADLLALAERWRGLASDYEHVKNFEVFLKTHVGRYQSLREH